MRTVTLFKLVEEKVLVRDEQDSIPFYRTSGTPPRPFGKEFVEIPIDVQHLEIKALFEHSSEGTISSLYALTPDATKVMYAFVYEHRRRFERDLEVKDELLDDLMLSTRQLQSQLHDIRANNKHWWSRVKNVFKKRGGIPK